MQMTIIDSETHHAGQRMRHELTDLEIKLLTPTGSGWRVHVVGAPTADYVVNLTADELHRRYRDVAE